MSIIIPKHFDFFNKSIGWFNDIWTSFIKFFAVLKYQHNISSKHFLSMSVISSRFIHIVVRLHMFHDSWNIHWIIYHTVVIVVKLLAKLICGNWLQKVCRLKVIIKFSKNIPTSLHHWITHFNISKRINNWLIVFFLYLSLSFHNYLIIVRKHRFIFW